MTFRAQVVLDFPIISKFARFLRIQLVSITIDRLNQIQLP